MLEIAWLIPLLPYAAFGVLIFWGQSLRQRIGEKVGWIGVAGIAATIPLAFGCLIELLLGASPVDRTLAWAAIGGKIISVGYAVDPLAAVMLVMISIVATCIQIYSIGYMHGDERFSRFFAYLSLFCGSMYMLVLANSFVMLYAGWEMVGLCSYLLIGFWFERPAASRAAIKAFITTRIGDIGFAIGILILFAYLPQLHFGAVFQAVHEGTIPATVAGIAALFLFCGAIGKSAQFPLHTWLPDAMEGPTPVSALIHAATMVAAGVYMVGRLFTIFYVPGQFAEGPYGGGLIFTPLTWIALIGLITALLAATIGIVQHDIKRVLAYSTISQLGYMMVGMGMGPVGMIAGIFHLITHAFFKALLFLGAGSVIHACHEEQNIWRMGGLARKAPLTYATFWAGTLALAGIFPFAGFFSKDEILAAAFHNATAHSLYWLFFIGLELGAFMTAFYMGRACYLTFSGTPRSAKAAQAHESPKIMTIPLLVLAIFAFGLGWIGSPWLGGNLFAKFVHYAPPAERPIVFGILSMPQESSKTGHFVASEELSFSPSKTTSSHEESHGFNWFVAGLSTLMALAGFGLAAAIYRFRILPVAWLKAPLYPLYVAAKHKFWFDDLYEGVIVRGVLYAAAVFRWLDLYVIDGAVNLVGWGTRAIVALIAGWIDKWIVDGLVNLIGWSTKMMGEIGARLQTGYVQEYISSFVLLGCALAAAVYLVILGAPYLEPYLEPMWQLLGR